MEITPIIKTAESTVIKKMTKEQFKLEKEAGNIKDTDLVITDELLSNAVEFSSIEERDLETPTLETGIISIVKINNETPIISILDSDRNWINFENPKTLITVSSINPTIILEKLSDYNCISDLNSLVIDGQFINENDINIITGSWSTSLSSTPLSYISGLSAFDATAPEPGKYFEITIYNKKVKLNNGI